MFDITFSIPKNLVDREANKSNMNFEINQFLNIVSAIIIIFAKNLY